jgi:hypothetical protein
MALVGRWRYTASMAKGNDGKTQILAMLCEGSSMRSISPVADVSINTVTKLLVDAGTVCAAFHDDKGPGREG